MTDPLAPPHVPVPTAEQLAWQALETGMFVHYGLNTFAGLEWSDGTLPAASFDPAGLDARDWVSTAVAMGARYLVLTAKHHDGFCLWPTDTTDYSVRSSPWRGGRGDVVEEVAAACREAGIGLGLYLSPWDRNAACYPDPVAYSAFYTRQLTELCTRYGDLVELWFDGAGSEGYRYDWDAIMAVADEHQPQAMVFNMGRPTIRWVGNEDGLAADPNSYAVAGTKLSQYTDVRAELGDALYLPPECDVSLRRGWFWHPDDEPKTLEHLLAIHERSVGLGANLLLNVPPTTSGTVDPADAARVAEYGAEVGRRYGRPVTLTPTRVDGRWRAEAPAPTAVDVVELREDLTRGQRVTGFRVLAGGSELAAGASIGHRRLVPVPRSRLEELVVELDGPGAVLAGVALHDTGVTRRPQIPEGYTAPTERPDDH
ncbi:alpha-L-fucosidase [Auraticoccus sp. F435]|uniref:alpha-L-fucosidase n=1 Tax=Auraticoccus cholistanensis TaxID=2656650 RepID=A0A6A9UT25_9ACTN|nr:alpha-L-fucosidase [Auraticoccus cholistanensis]MVA74885.1 alpha-L-fucosidase [Auraticoccus cholistanensis]